ncbi:MAG TPA: universal stress protein [Desulfuromonadales bacterium]|nr:universal stress protein [Desulfuromonadales bacterium]
MDRKVLVPVNGSAAANRMIEAIIGRKAQFRAPLTVLHVVNVERLAYRMIPAPQLEMIREAARKSGEHLLQEQVARFLAAGVACTGRLEFGSPRETICRIANEERFDLVILGRRESGEIRDVLFGAVSNHVLHHVRCPVLLI